MEPVVTTQAPKAKKQELWLNALYDPLTRIKTDTTLLRFADLRGDGEVALIVCDYNKKIKVFEGMTLVVEYALMDLPTALCVCYSDEFPRRVPNLAVAAGSYIFLYRDMKPFRKWTCPPVQVAPEERDVWGCLRDGTTDAESAVKNLAGLRDSGIDLTTRSINFLCLKQGRAREEYVKVHSRDELEQHSLVTCMDSLKQSRDDDDAMSMLVVGTECQYVYILPPDPASSHYVTKQKLPSVPVLMNSSGLFHAEWRVAVICRDGTLYSVKNGDITGQSVVSGVSIPLGAQAVALAQQDTLLWISTMDNKICSYTTRGQKQREILLDSPLVDMCMLSFAGGGARGGNHDHALLAVALSNGQVKLYKNSRCVDTISVEAPIKAMRFGRYGREDNSLALIHGLNGSLSVKIWRRRNDVAALQSDAGPPPEQDVPLPIPKKTKLWMEMTAREAEEGPDIHRLFQRDLCSLRLEAAKAYVKVLTDSKLGSTRGALNSGTAAGGTSANPNASSVKLHVKVEGLGPKFLLKITLHNLGTYPILRAKLLFNFDAAYYSLGYSARSQQVLNVPVLLPGVKTTYETEVLCIDELGRGGNILILLQGGPDYTGTSSDRSSGAEDSKVGENDKDAKASNARTVPKVPQISAVPIASASVIMPAAEMFDATP